MKPLTIDELKALQVGDWVWIFRLNNKRASGYVTDINFTARMFTCKSVNRVSTTARIADYGKTWLAYKNKEQAEAKGEIVELPCKVGDKVYVLVYMFCEWIIAEITVIKERLYDACIDFESGFAFFTREEAEARLAELTRLAELKGETQ